MSHERRTRERLPVARSGVAVDRECHVDTSDQRAAESWSGLAALAEVLKAAKQPRSGFLRELFMHAGSLSCPRLPEHVGVHA